MKTARNVGWQGAALRVRLAELDWSVRELQERLAAYLKEQGSSIRVPGRTTVYGWRSGAAPKTNRIAYIRALANVLDVPLKTLWKGTLK
jgi:hypothetical protein